MPVMEPEEGVSVAVEDIPALGAILGEMTTDMVNAVIALRTLREVRDAAREVAVDALDRIHTEAPGTDPEVIAGLEKVIFLLREGGAR